MPLFSVVYMLFVRGGHKLSVALFTQLPPAALEEGGGFGNAILGTLVMVGIAALISRAGGHPGGRVPGRVRSRDPPGPGGPLRRQVLTGFPSILAGVFAYGAVVLLTGGFSAHRRRRGAVAADAADRDPDRRRCHPHGAGQMREAAIGMGATPTQTICRVLLPTAMPGILTGVMLAIARAAGETAPLLFTALFSNYWPISRAHAHRDRSRRPRWPC